MSDTEPPTCVDCSADIVIDNATETQIRVNWDRPTCTDNSGENPTMSSNRQSGDLFDVPGSYEVTYTATDTYLNKNENCSFRITLESKYFTSLGLVFGEIKLCKAKSVDTVLRHACLLPCGNTCSGYCCIYIKKKQKRNFQPELLTIHLY